MQNDIRDIKAVHTWLERLRGGHINCGCGQCDLLQELTKDKIRLEKKINKIIG